MPEYRSIVITNLLVDNLNPRLAEEQQNQPGTIHALLQAEGEKTLALAEDVANQGLSPADRFLVTPAPDGPNRFIALEGNRRLTALKILSEPKLADPALSKAEADRLRKWSVAYKKRGEIDAVDCAVFVSRTEAEPWIVRRHAGELEGVGIVRWGTTERQRFDARRSGKKSAELQVFDYVRERGSLDTAMCGKLGNFPITSLKRLLADRAVREALGVDIDRDGNVIALYSDKEILKGLTRVVRDLANGMEVSKIYNADARRAYVDGFKPSERPEKSHVLDQPRRLVNGNRSASPAGSRDRGARNRSPGPSKTLIPSSAKLKTTLPKLTNIVRELRALKLDSYENAISVLFRVFIELSVDEAIEKEKLMPSDELKQAKLSKKLQVTATHLQKTGLLTEKQARVVRAAASDNSLIATSVQTFHQYVHNQYFSPSPHSLRTAWNNLAPFLEAIWV